MNPSGIKMEYAVPSILMLGVYLLLKPTDWKADWNP